MLALARMNHLTKASNVGNNNSNSSTNNDEHPPTMINNEKMLLLNPNINQEPTTPCVLNTPNTCTKNSTFFYEIPSGVHTPTLNGKFFFFLAGLLEFCLILTWRNSSSCSSFVLFFHHTTRF